MPFQQESLDLGDVEAYELEITVNGETVKETQVILATENELNQLISVKEAIDDFKKSKVIVLYRESGRLIVINYEDKPEDKIAKRYKVIKKAAKSLVEITNKMKIQAINLKVEGVESSIDLFINVLYVQNHKYERKMKSNNILGKEDFQEKEDQKYIEKTFCQIRKINLESQHGHENLKQSMQFSKAQIFAKNLGSLRANQGSTINMKKVCEQIVSELGEKVNLRVVSGQDLLENRLNLIHAVGRANPNEPCMVDMTFMNNPDSKEVISLVGKGIVFDAGGLNIKQTLIEQMWVDKCGACNVVSIFRYAVKMDLKINLTCTVGWAENSVGGNSFRPSDIIQSYKGISVEIGNTDAEGRLVLADCMSYAQLNHKTTTLIELSTLTGAMIVALGFSGAGCYGNSEDLQGQLVKSSQQKGECVVAMPIFDENHSNNSTTVADVCNLPSSVFGGAGSAAAFLTTFIEEGVDYAHLDIAGVSLDMPGKQATGVIVQTILNYLASK